MMIRMVVEKRDRMRRVIIIIIVMLDVSLGINKIKMRMEDVMWKEEVDHNQEKEGDTVQVKVLS